MPTNFDISAPQKSCAVPYIRACKDGGAFKGDTNGHYGCRCIEICWRSGEHGAERGWANGAQILIEPQPVVGLQGVHYHR